MRPQQPYPTDVLFLKPLGRDKAGSGPRRRAQLDSPGHRKKLNGCWITAVVAGHVRQEEDKAESGFLKRQEPQNENTGLAYYSKEKRQLLAMTSSSSTFHSRSV